MNILVLIVSVCILSSTTLGRKKRSPESNYWIEYEPIPKDQRKTDSRSEVSTEPQDNYNVVYKDTGYAENETYPMPAPVPQVQNTGQQVANPMAAPVPQVQNTGQQVANPMPAPVPQVQNTGQQVANPIPAPVPQVQHTGLQVANAAMGSPSQPAQQVCHRALDLGIIFDSSYTLEGAAWQEEKRTAQALIDKLEVDENGVHIGVMVFSTEVEIAVPFNGYKDVQELKQDIEGIDFMNGWSRTDLALEAAKHQLFSPNGGSRDGVPKALIVLSDGLTDGESLPDRSTNWTERLVPVVDELRRDGFNIFCIGIGNALTAELNVIASDKNSVFRPADLEILVSKLNAISKQQCYNEKNIPNPPQCATSCVFPSICLLAVQPTCLPPSQQTVTCTIPGACTSTAITTATSTEVVTTTSTDISTSTEVRILPTETETKTAIETSTHTTTATDTLTETAVSTSTDFHTITKTDTSTHTHYVTETNTETATSTKVHKTTETLSTTDIDTITSTHVTTATQTAIATSTAIATRYVTSTHLTTSTDIDTSTHITTATSTALETSTKTHVTTATDTSTAVTTATEMKTLTTTSTALTTSIHLMTDVSTKVLTDTRFLTTTQTQLESSTHVTTSTGFTTSTLYATRTKTETNTAVVTSTALAVSTKVLTTTSTDLATSTHVTTATRTKTETNTAVVTSTALAVSTKVLTTTSTDLATSTHVTTATRTKTETNTAVVTSTALAVSTKVLTTTSTDLATSTHVTTATSTNVHTSTAIDTKTLTTVSTDVSTSTHVTTETSTAVATRTSTAVVSVTATQTRFTTVTSTDVDTQITTATSTKIDTSTTTDTKTLTTVSTDVSTSTHVTTHTSTDVVSVTDTKTKVKTVTSTDVDTSTSIHVTTATITATRTSTAVATSTAVTTSTDTSTETEVLTTVKTTTESLTQTATKTSTVMSTSVVTSCSFNCPSTSPTPSLTSAPPPETTSINPTTPPITGCKKVLDVGILLHDSRDIPAQSYTTLKNFVAQFASQFSVSLNGAHFGSLSFDDESSIDFKFSDTQYYNTDKLQEKIKGLHQMGPGSRIDLAIEKANQKLFSSAGGYRTEMPKALIVFTEQGSSAGSKPYAQVIAPLSAKGVRIIAVGITNKVGRDELIEIANGDEKNIFMVNTFDDLSSIMQDLIQRTCDTPVPEPPKLPEILECSVEYKKLGCYEEHSLNPSMPERLLSNTPDWSNFASWLQKFVCQCAEKAKQKKYSVFGVRDTGECVSGPESADMYQEYGESANCVDGHFATCKNDNKNECCGEKTTNYVYGVIIESKPTPTTPAPTTPTPKPEPCKAVVDLVFVMDGSGSIEHFGSGNFNRCKKFAKDMVNNFEISKSGTHVGLLLFSSTASVVFALDEHYDIASIETAIDGIAYPEGGTYIGNALALTKSGIIDVSSRSNVHRIIIVMTDGESSDEVTGPSKALKDAGNSLYVLGIGNSFDVRELNKIASDPDQDYVFTSGFNELDKAVKSIKEKACTEASKPLPTPVVIVPDAKFTREPPFIVYIRIGATIRFVWEYQVNSRNTAFARYSPIWYYYYSSGASVALASEDKNTAWQWGMSSTCPASYEGRISKEGQATLVITSVAVSDGGYYGCSLEMVSGTAVLSKVQLVLLDARFTRTPPQVVYAYVGETVRLEWLYSIDGGRDNAFGINSPTWNLYYSESEYAELAFEDKNSGWKWSISDRCPASLKGRLTKESDATLVISEVTIGDSGIYGCSLVMVSGQPVISKVQLVVREKPEESVFKVEFTKLPPKELYVYAGEDVKLEWEYTVTGDKNTGFARYSPTWNLYNVEGQAIELASEDKYSSWEWKVSSTCPESLRYRLKKESSANLVISKATLADSGTYGCSLDLAFGEPLIDSVKLIVTEKSTPTEEVTPPCKAVVDLVFLIDGSTSIEQFGMGNFKRCLNFAKTMVRNFEVSSQGTHVGVVMFTTTAKVEFTLTKYSDAADIEEAIDSIKYPSGGTFAGEGLKMVKNSVFDEFGRSSVPHVLIIMTDGQSIDDIETPSTALKNDGTFIYSLGIGSEYNMQQLNTMASAPSSSHVFVADFDKLDTVVESIKQKACSDASLVTPTIKPITEQPPTAAPMAKCKTTVDLAFLIDGSTSIETAGAGNFDRCKNFVKEMISNFDISQSGTHIGVAQFASRVFVNFTFNEYYEKASIDKAIDDIPMLYGGTNLGKALTTIRTDLFDVGSRNSVPRILIVMSDGASEDAVDEPSKALRDQGITVFSLGIGNNINKQQLNIIATDPDSDHVFTSGFNELSSVVSAIEQKVCPEDIWTINSQSSSSTYTSSYGYCSVRYNKLGCYGDDHKDPRPLPTQLFTDRNPDSDLFSGITMNLGQWDQYMSDVVCRCAKNAESRDFKLFSIQNFGECWSGIDAETTYNRNGESESCISNKMETCDAENQLPCVGNKTSNYVYEIDFARGKQAEACSVTYEKVGCFKDNQVSPRPFSELVTTDLDPKSEVYSGSPVNKGDWNTYLADMVCRCAQNTQEYEYEYFGIQKLGECWSGPAADKTYKSDGQSDQCVSKDMKTCVSDSPDNCAGQDNTNFVYRIQKTNMKIFSGPAL